MHIGKGLSLLRLVAVIAHEQVDILVPGASVKELAWNF
jgi:hypothetical protein